MSTTYFGNSFIYLIEYGGADFSTKINTVNFSCEGGMKLVDYDTLVFFVRHVGYETRNVGYATRNDMMDDYIDYGFIDMTSAESRQTRRQSEQSGPTSMPTLPMSYEAALLGARIFA